MKTDEQSMRNDLLPATGIEDEHVREVYARFGLAVYAGQVLEHEIVNAITVLDLIPNKRHLANSRSAWEAEVDLFVDKNFEKTMGSMIKTLSELIKFDNSFEANIRSALKIRNYLVHSFFRDNALEFMTAFGRNSMLTEIGDSLSKIESATLELSMLIKPIRVKYGLTDDLIQEEFERSLGEIKFS